MKKISLIVFAAITIALSAQSYAMNDVVHDGVLNMTETTSAMHVSRSDLQTPADLTGDVYAFDLRDAPAVLYSAADMPMPGADLHDKVAVGQSLKANISTAILPTRLDYGGQLFVMQVACGGSSAGADALSPSMRSALLNTH